MNKYGPAKNNTNDLAAGSSFNSTFEMNERRRASRQREFDSLQRSHPESVTSCEQKSQLKNAASCVQKSHSKSVISYVQKPLSSRYLFQQDRQHDQGSQAVEGSAVTATTKSKAQH